MFLVAALVGMMSQAVAETIPAPAKAVKKVSFKKTKPAKVENTLLSDDSAELDTTSLSAMELNCELGRKMTVYRKSKDEGQIAVRWKEKLLRFLRVDTQTGAHRYENEKHGLVWIGIPGKSMLLDSKNGRQLANECMNAEQAQEALKAKG
jgi:hypothetical protein